MIYQYRTKMSPQERRAINLTTQSLAAGTWKRLRRRASGLMLITAVSIGVNGASVLVTPDLNNSSQSHVSGNHHNMHPVFVVLHGEYFSLTHVKISLCRISTGSGDGKGCDSCESTAVVRRHSRLQSKCTSTHTALSVGAILPGPPGTMLNNNPDRSNLQWSRPHRCVRFILAPLGGCCRMFY
ncbi:hypothetical protein HPB51_014051 [Rhipicephalus microplus]|uniref:Uncharacterized protein n=1 Tax=Rhipicephalus microplus TaxID=6941 RepID=A0A9J6EA81_RHIMP|nr:hypothetical protein HPB51_014051 [Rhipicephalus microplus]